MKKLLLFSVLLLTCIFSAKSETVKWMVRPQYDNIKIYSQDIFKCYLDGKVQLLDRSGKELLSSPADSVTDYSEGYALILDRKNNLWHIRGFLAEQGHSFQTVTGEFYTNRYSFFSEGYLSVSDENGRQGYLNTQGQVQIKCNYQKARPFQQGWASVQTISKDKKTRNVIYITPSNGRMTIPKFHDGQLTEGSSFNSEGEAIVANYSELAILSLNGDTKKARGYDIRNLPIRSYDYVFDPAKTEIKKTNRMPQEDARFQVFNVNGIYGYTKNGSVIVPAQFSEAKSFTDGDAIVAIGGRYGILQILPGDFSASLNTQELKVYQGTKFNKLNCQLEVPASIDRNSIEFKLDNGNGNLVSMPLQDKTSFLPSFNKDDSECNIRASVSSDGLLLWEYKETINLIYININVSVPVLTDEYADENDCQKIKAVITNNSKVSVDVKSTFGVSLKSGSKNTIKVPAKSEGAIAPGGKLDLYITVGVAESEKAKTSISVKVDGHDCGTKESIIEFKLI